MTGVSKRFFIGMAIFAIALMVLFGTGQLKTSASESWGQKVTEIYKNKSSKKSVWNHS